MILKARFVVPVDSPVIENGALVVNDDRIVEVVQARDVTGRDVVDFGDAVICPGFVNAHTHLELSDFKGKIAPRKSLTDWLDRLVQAMRSEARDRDAIRKATLEGIRDSLRAGVTTVGDITRHPEHTRPVLAQSLLRAVSFGEVISIGKTRHRLEEQVCHALNENQASDSLRIGLSPHSPYTVEPNAMRDCAEQAAVHRLPLCIHLAESADEEVFTRKREGAIAEYLKRIGVWDDEVPISEMKPVELVERSGLLTPRTVAAHANYVSDADIAQLARSGTSVAYCPRTHAAFDHEPHRFREMLRAGVNVCVGTDSLASNPSLSVLDELRYLRRQFVDIPSERLLEMGTIHGAKALAFDRIVGTLSPGKIADVVVIPLRESGDHWDSVFLSDASPVAVYVAGCLVDDET